MKFSQSPKTFAVRKLDGPIIIGKLCCHYLDDLYEVSSEDGSTVLRKDDVLRYFDVTEQQLEVTVNVKLKEFEVCGNVKSGFYIDQLGSIRRGDKFVELIFDSKKFQIGLKEAKMFLEPQS